MANGFVKTREGAKIYLYRANTANGSLSSTQYLPESQFKVGVDNGTPSTASTDLDSPIPITNGTVNDDGSNNFTGSSGGDNSTDNTTTYKPGGNVIDNTAQNLIKNDSNATAIWTIANLAAAGTNIDSSQYAGFWIYIKDTTTLAKLVSSGTALQIKLGSDTSNYYSKTYEDGDLATGWNWFDLGLVSALTETGTVAGDIDTFILEITTNNATDEFVAGDVVYDLLRQWEETDLYKDYVSGYPSTDLTNLEVQKQAYLTTVDAVGFNINGYADYNKDTTPILTNEATITDRGKSDTDEFIFISVDRIIL